MTEKWGSGTSLKSSGLGVGEAEELLRANMGDHFSTGHFRFRRDSEKGNPDRETKR